MMFLFILLNLSNSPIFAQGMNEGAAAGLRAGAKYLDYKFSKIECLRKIQSKFENFQENKLKPVGMAMPSKKPTDLVIGDGGEIAWVDGKGTIRISSEKGSVSVNGRNCTSGTDLKSDVPIQMAYEYMNQYEVSKWQEIKEFCNSVGVVSNMEAAAPAAGERAGAKGSDSTR